MGSIFTSPLVGGPVSKRDRAIRLALFLLWAALVAVFLSNHALWRDEVRAFSLALSGDNFGEMLANVQGEGHPALWYLLLRAVHELFPYREVLPVAGAVVGIAAMAMVAFFSPFRTAVVAMILFSAFGAFEYVVISRNYGIAALAMFAIAALYPRVKGTLWLGLLIALLANTNVPSAILAGCMLLFRFVELLGERGSTDRKSWMVFAGNALIAAIGAYACFRTVYPTVNDGAVSKNLNSPGLETVFNGLVDTDYGFAHLGIWSPLTQVLLLLSCLAFIRRPAALCASIAGLVALKLFFYTVYLSYYRHEIQLIVFLISLHWMVANGAGGQWPERRWHSLTQAVGSWSFVVLLIAQTALLSLPIVDRFLGIPYSRSADVAEVLRRPELRNAIVMADPDTALEPLPYYVDNPLWLLRAQRFGNVAPLSRKSRSVITPDTVLADARMLHARTGRPVVYLSHLDMERRVVGTHRFMFHNVFKITDESRARFRASTRLVARTRLARSGEHFDIYVYPR